MTQLVVVPEHRALFDALGLTDFERVIDHFGGERPREERVVVRAGILRSTLSSPLAVFYKQYDYRGGSWKFLWRASKARCEFRNYAALERLGVRCAQRIAFGERRDWLGRLERAFLLTQAVPDTQTLVEFEQRACADRSTAAARALRDRLSRQLAAMTRRIHEAGFFHHDLVWRNVLVQHTPPSEPQVWWIDCPRGGFDRWSPWRARRRLKDLASLDKQAKLRCTRGERLAFLMHYLQKDRVDADVKRLAREVLAYGQARWPSG
jgi:tRNA A-37 threonylcarbamoyl transferase component Bud32